MSLINPVLSAGYYTGLHQLFSPWFAGIGCVLMLHRIEAGPLKDAFAPNRELAVSPDYLRNVIRFFRAHDWDIVSLDEMCERLADPSSRRRFAVFTFDDGYRDNLELALPVFEAEQAPFTIYVTTGLIDRTDVPWWYLVEDLLAGRDALDIDAGATHLPAAGAAGKQAAFEVLRERLVNGDAARNRALISQLASALGTDPASYTGTIVMDWREISDLAAHPLVTIGAHGVTHAALSKLDEARARAEITGSGDRLEQQTGRRPAHFCYPFGGRGECGAREYRLAREAGYRSATTTYKGNIFRSHNARMHALPRLALKGSQQALRYLAVHLSGYAGIFYNGLRRAGP